MSPVRLKSGFESGRRIQVRLGGMTWWYSCSSSLRMLGKSHWYT